ncbi:MAG: glycosyltransferase [Bacteroidales bacterium]|nr:glycosyltransferase [Bacteroidales bacterium]
MKILVFLPRFPYPLNKGDKLRAFNQIKVLSENNDIYLFALTKKRIKEEYIKQVRKYCKDIRVQRLNVWEVCLSLLKCTFDFNPFQVALFTTYTAKKSFSEYFRQIKPDSVYFQFVRSAEYAKTIRKIVKKNIPNSHKENSDTIKNASLSEKQTARLVLDFQDCLSMNMLRRAEISSLPIKFILMQEVKRLRKYENSMFNIFDATTIITKQDKECIISPERKNIKIIENGVDKKFFGYEGNTKKEFDLIFSGNMSYKPNVVAAKYLIEDIMPLVWKSNPEVRVCIAGSNPTADIKSLSCENVFVTGWVDDMREYYAKSLIFIAPMQIGTGLQNKLLEAMAMMLPCITTPLAFYALGAKQNEDILVGNNTEELASHILELLNDASYQYSIANAGNSFVKEKYSWRKSTDKLEKILKN